MTTIKTKSLERLESRMEGVETGSIRHQALDCAKKFKTSWVELGQVLYSIWKDKSYKSWGYMTFDAYTAKEIGIKKQTAMKLLKSYYFLEKEEPSYLTKDHSDAADAATLPSYETVNILRLAKDNEAVDRSDYNRLKRDVFEKGKEPSEIKKDLTAMMRQREEIDPEEAREKKRTSTIRRFVGTLKAMKRELEISKMVPSAVLKEIDSLIERVESAA
ncbi:MAG: hypothetical protein KBB52_06855 [Candidatus Omnitrophica bacterium]|nr:hypothetical protein [Candidatus Omnitrophota bacterium]